MKIMLQLKLENANGIHQIIDIHKVVGIKSDIPTILTIEKMPNGGNRLAYNEVKIPDLTQVQGLTFIRQKD